MTECSRRNFLKIGAVGAMALAINPVEVLSSAEYGWPVEGQVVGENAKPYTQPLSVAFPDGDTLIGWISRDGTFHMRNRDRFGRLGNERVLSSDSAAFNPHAGRDNSGTAHIVWQTANEVRYMKRAPDGEFSEPTILRPPRSIVSQPKIIQSDSGREVIVFNRDSTEDPWKISSSFINPDGQQSDWSDLPYTGTGIANDLRVTTDLEDAHIYAASSSGPQEVTWRHLHRLKDGAIWRNDSAMPQYDKVRAAGNSIVGMDIRQGTLQAHKWVFNQWITLPELDRGSVTFETAVDSSRLHVVYGYIGQLDTSGIFHSVFPNPTGSQDWVTELVVPDINPQSINLDVMPDSLNPRSYRIHMAYQDRKNTIIFGSNRSRWYGLFAPLLSNRR